MKTHTEHRQEINGLDGLMFNSFVRDETKGTFHSQTWKSSRPIDGYGPRGTITVEIRHGDECGNGHNTFTIAADIRNGRSRSIEACGCLHEDIARVFPELAHLIKWHFMSTDGPMHYIANTMYHASDVGEGKEIDLEAARSCAVWPDATIEQLSDRAALEARLPALLQEFRAAVESCGMEF